MTTAKKTTKPASQAKATKAKETTAPSTEKNNQEQPAAGEENPNPEIPETHDSPEPTEQPIPEDVKVGEVEMLQEIAHLNEELTRQMFANSELSEKNNAAHEELEKLRAILADSPTVPVVIPYKKSDSQGKELMLAIMGWRRHFKENMQMIIVGDREDFFDETILHIPHECNTDNPPLDIVAKLKELFTVCPEIEDFVLTNDDIYPVNDFDLTEVRLFKCDGLLSDSKSIGNLYAKNRQKTLELLRKEGKPIYDYGCHTPILMNAEQLLEMFEKYDMEKNSYLVSSLYFNTYYPSRIPLKISLETDHLKVGVYKKTANLGRLPGFMKRKIWVNNSQSGWTPEFEKIMVDYYAKE